MTKYRIVKTNGTKATATSRPYWDRLRQNLVVKALAIFLIFGAGMGVLSACTGGSADDKKREAELKNKPSADVMTLEKKNLEKKRAREEKADTIGYVYVINFGKIFGYYTVKGKVSSNGSQRYRDQDVEWTCRDGHGCSPVVVNAPEDDGSYGPSEPGIFFFTDLDIKVVTNLDYIWSEEPLPIDVPRIDPKKKE